MADQSLHLSVGNIALHIGLHESLGFFAIQFHMKGPSWNQAKQKVLIKNAAKALLL
jgi:hypothetical protein